MASRLINKTRRGTNCLRKIILSKWIVKYTCLYITLLLLLLAGLMLYFDFSKILAARNLYYELFIGHYFLLLLKFWPIIEGIILIVTVFGIVAIMIEKSTFVKLYGIITFLTFVVIAMTGVFMVAIAIYAIPETYSKFDELMEVYDYDFDSRTNIDYLQHDIKCCGYYGPSDWGRHLVFYKYSNSNDFVPSTAPRSCCIDSKCSSYYRKGCRESVNLIIAELIIIILIISSTLSILLLLAVSTTFRFKKKIDKIEFLPRVKISRRIQPQSKNYIENSFEDHPLEIQEFSNVLVHNLK